MLSIRNLSKTYSNGVRALSNVTLEIPPGMFGLLGPNGAGKSSLMRTIATLQDPDAGSILFDGVDLLANKERTRQTLGYLPQDFGLYPKVSAIDMLDHFAALKGLVHKGERRETVQALLQQVNLWDARDRKLGTFSGGMRQRFGIAQALIGSPRLVIVDDVADLCANMAIISKGEVLMSGKPRDAIAEIRGKVWSKQIAKAVLPEYQQRFEVLSARLIGGQPRIHVLSDHEPEHGFEAVEPDLEGVYFLKLRRNGAAGQAATHQ